MPSVYTMWWLTCACYPTLGRWKTEFRSTSIHREFEATLGYWPGTGTVTLFPIALGGLCTDLTVRVLFLPFNVVRIFSFANLLSVNPGNCCSVLTLLLSALLGPLRGWSLLCLPALCSYHVDTQDHMKWRTAKAFNVVSSPPNVHSQAMPKRRPSPATGEISAPNVHGSLSWQGQAETALTLHQKSGDCSWEGGVLAPFSPVFPQDRTHRCVLMSSSSSSLIGSTQWKKELAFLGTGPLSLLFLNPRREKSLHGGWSLAQWENAWEA